MKRFIAFVLMLILVITVSAQTPLSTWKRGGPLGPTDIFINSILNGTDTFTNKTLTSPTITGASLSGTSAFTGLVTVTTSSALTSGTIRSVNVSQTHTGDGAAILEALRVNIASAVQTGSWANAIVGRIAYSGATGDAGGGMAAAICAEMVLPAITGPAGQYFAVDLEFDAQASYVANAGTSFPTAYIRFGLFGNGTAIASFEDDAYFMHVSTEFTDASGNMWFDNTLRIQIEATDWFIPLSDAEGEFSTAYLIDVSNATDASSLSAASIATEGGLAVTKQLFLGDDLDMTVSGTGVYDITLKDGVADALSIVRGTTDMMVFNTTAPSITITPATTITGLLTANGSVAVGDADYIGITSNEIITFATAGTVTVSGADFVVGETAADNILRQVRVIGDADSDGAAAVTSETATLALTPNATPTLATWGFSSTQGYGWTFDKTLDVAGALTAGTITSDAGVGGTTGTFTDEVDITKSTVGMALDVNYTATSITTLVGAVDIRRTGALTGVATESILDLNVLPALTLTEPASGTVNYFGANIDLTSVAVTAGVGTSVLSALNLVAGTDADAGTNYALTMTGNAYMVGELNIGLSGSRMSLAANTNQSIRTYTTSPTTTGNHWANQMHHQNSATTTGTQGVLWVENDVIAQAAGQNAAYFKIDMNALQAPTGGVSVINAEMVMPTGTQNGGVYSAIVVDVDCPATTDLVYNAALPLSFMKLEVYGATADEWNECANLFYLSGIVDTSDGLFEAEAASDIDMTHVLRINIGGIAYWIALNTDKDFTP